jgi:hypothetical protein
MPQVFVVNNYSLEYVWEQVRRGEKPNHHLYGINYFHLRGYEVKLIPFKNLPFFQFVDKSLGKLPSLVPLGCLDQQWACLKRLAQADLIYAPCQTQTHLLTYFRALGLIKVPIVCVAHHPLDRGGRLDKFRAPFFKLQIQGTDAFPSLSAKVSEQILQLSDTSCQSEILSWGPDPGYYPQTSELGTGIVAAGRTGRDFSTFGKAASLTEVPTKIICLQSDFRKEFQAFRGNVKVIVQSDEQHMMYPELLEIYAKARVIAIPLSGGNSLSGLTSLMDALGMGKPVIMTKQPFIDLDIEVEEIGIWVNVGDVDGWRKAIQFFEDNPEQAIVMGKRARKIADTYMNSLSFSNAVMDIFDKVLKRK